MAALSSDVSLSARNGGKAVSPVGYVIRHYPRVGSTSDEAKRLADQGAADRTMILADEQDGGRGRYGRSWTSPPGNLYASFVYRPDVAPNDAAKIGYVASVAVAEVVSRFIGPNADVFCKWPNDVLVGDKKIAGILPEASINAGGLVDWIVLGIGVNIVSSPPGTHWPSTSLQASGMASAGRVLAVDSVLTDLCQSLDFWLDRWLCDGFGPVREAWMTRAWSVGEDIRTVLPERTLTGRFLGIDETGALLLATDDGREEKIHYGEIFPVEAR